MKPFNRRILGCLLFLSIGSSDVGSARMYEASRDFYGICRDLQGMYKEFIRDLYSSRKVGRSQEVSFFFTAVVLNFEVWLVLYPLEPSRIEQA